MSVLTIHQLVVINEKLEADQIRIHMSDACGSQSFYVKEMLSDRQKARVSAIITEQGLEIEWLPGNRYFVIK